MPGKKKKKKPFEAAPNFEKECSFSPKNLLLSRSVYLHTCSPEISQPRRKVAMWCPRDSRANSLVGRHGSDFYLIVYKICLTQHSMATKRCKTLWKALLLSSCNNSKDLMQYFPGVQEQTHRQGTESWAPMGQMLTKWTWNMSGWISLLLCSCIMGYFSCFSEESFSNLISQYLIVCYWYTLQCFGWPPTIWLHNEFQQEKIISKFNTFFKSYVDEGGRI